MRIIFILFFISSQCYCQVLTQDSLALVALYNSTNGTAWTNNTNWLTGNVSTWAGVYLTSNRVTHLFLQNNNLSGTLPDEFCNLTALKYLFMGQNNLTGSLPACFGNLQSLNSIEFENNKLTGAIPPSVLTFTDLADIFIKGNMFNELPNLTSLIEITNVSIENNRFTFEDIEPNVGILNFLYSPQDSIGVAKDTIILIHDTASFSIYTPGTANVYQWMKDGADLTDDHHISGSTTPTLTIKKATPADTGIYICKISNTIATALTLYSRAIRIRINDTRLDQTIYFDTLVLFCGDLPRKIPVSGTIGASLMYEVISGSAEINGDTLVPLQPGIVTIRAYNHGNDFYKPVSKDTTIIVQPSSLPPVAIFGDSTITAGSTLLLEASTSAADSFTWFTPWGQVINNATVEIKNTTVSHEGNYYLQSVKNKCLYRTDTVYVNVSELPPPETKDIIVYEYMSPDQDGKNETFYIKNIEAYTDNSILIFNSDGKVVYTTTGYTNDWRGENVPGGTYYYQIHVPSIEYKARGVLFIKK